MNKVKYLKAMIARLSCSSRLANGFTKARHDDQLPENKAVGIGGLPLVWTRSMVWTYRDSVFAVRVTVIKKQCMSNGIMFSPKSN